jgi:hypothetical protein
MGSGIVHGEGLHRQKIKKNLKQILIIKDMSDDVFGR